jgi:hypothetical protein
MLCNVRKSGNYVTFRENLIKDVGEEAVVQFENERHTTVHDFDRDTLVTFLEEQLRTEYHIEVVWHGKRCEYKRI